MSEMPQGGYGTYQTQQELALELEREQRGEDEKSITYREQNERITAKKVISKINSVSHRIINSNQITRKVEILEEEKERLKKEGDGTKHKDLT
jgi:hypothetical protein